MNESSLLEIILLAMVAGFVLLRLRSVLGRRIGHEQQNPPPMPTGAAGPDQTVREMRPLPAPFVMPDGHTASGLLSIHKADPNFEPGAFLDGAKAAYEAIVTAFAAGNKQELRPLLADDVYDSFCQAIDQRLAAKQSQETRLVAFKAVEIPDADIKGSIAEITVKFVAELIRVTRNAEGQIVAGSASGVDEVTDVWSFSRDVGTRDPNWLLIGTSTAA